MTDYPWRHLQDYAENKRLLTYGEMPIDSLAAMLKRLSRPITSDDVFVDIGSGCGRLVLAAAMMHPSMRY